MELKVINEQGQEAAKLQASDVLFGRDFNEALVHQVVVAYQANARSGDRQQKDRSEVRHTTTCLLYTSDAADERSSVDLGGRRIIKKKNITYNTVICRTTTKQ